MIGEKIRQQPWQPLPRRPPQLWPWRRRRPLVCWMCSTAWVTREIFHGAFLLVFFDVGFDSISPRLLCCLIDLYQVSFFHPLLLPLISATSFSVSFRQYLPFSSSLFFWYIVFVLMVCAASV
jgi:hypothetical protein